MREEATFRRTLEATTTTMKAFYLNDQTARRVGYCFREGDKMILIDRENNVYRVSSETSAREAVRILLSNQQFTS